ncbi:response regulator transcription factor [Leucobacter sp. CSA1]|uniref:Response regulator transcription factor n=1 Tax=Leucobacter chromiisoli TaxID=2796471 RepID=A0A934Q4Q5_9MICO|nr:response regulator transcription factor [Leucobacter chromiisoli]MBK0417521.1 response regulator transcription factor [Leucobacter chromiisoli]
MIRVLVVDDHPIVRAGIAGLLDGEPGLEVVAEAASGEEAVGLAAALRADVVLMDLRMPGIGGVEATRRIVQGAAESPAGAEGVKVPEAPESAESPAGADASDARPAPRVLVFTTYEDDDQILVAIAAGASGYLLKAAPAEELVAGVRAVAAGQTVLAPSIAAQLVARASGAGARAVDERPAPALTPRETEILALVAEGFSNPEIAARLFIGESTVKTHLLHVFEKLEVSDRTRAVLRAMELGILG